MERLNDSLLELITETATNLPSDIRKILGAAYGQERPGTQAAQALHIINLNVDQAKQNVSPICQDTGMPTFYVHTPVGVNQLVIKKAIQEMIAEATRTGKLRPNSVDSITGKNSGLNLGPGTPVIHFEQWEEDDIEVMLLLKGGGCENKNIQYSLPATLEHVGKVGRDLEGIYKCIMHAVWQAQGQGCSAGFIGVCVGGDRTTGYEGAKGQLFLDQNSANPDPVLAEMEARVMVEANELGVGTMGFGGKVTLLGCKIGALNRLPASFFVSVAYSCWAFRRLGIRIDPNTGEIKSWQFRDANPTKMAQEAGFPTTGSEFHLTTPLQEQDVRQLKVGDLVLLSGEIVTGRDELHKYLMTHDSPVDLHGAALYHCGPVMLKDEDGDWKLTAAGPTTSIREEPYQAEILKKFGVRAVIGKGGMGAKTLEGLRESGAVYLNAIGGAAQFYAEALPEVLGVDFLEEFGIPEAMWRLRAKNFVAVVTMDSHGNSLHADVEKSSGIKLELLLAAK
ncbi:MAG: fumarate hydratase [Chthonomonadaceae bacterium]|nr:fumarate hydratase [Chthonomonadaceae bacterium]